MSPKILRLLFLLVPAVLLADNPPPDPAVALQKQIQDLEKRQRRDQQKIDQAEEQERIKLRAKERDERARVQRDVTSAVATATAGAVATGTSFGYDPAKFGQLKFADDEVTNLIQNKLGPEVTQRFDRERKELDRKYSLERAKLEVPAVDPSDDASKQQHDLALKTADLNATYQQKYDDLALEQAAEEAKCRFEHTTKINEAERDLAILVYKHSLDAAKSGSAAPWNPAADPDYAKLTAARDQAKSDLETAVDEIRAKYNGKRTDLDNAKEDDQAKLSGT